MPLHTKHVDWHHSSRRSVAEVAKGLTTLATERWKWVVAVVIGLLALSAIVAGYYAWSSKNETNAAAFLRKAVSQLEASTRAGQDSAKQEEGVRLLREVMSRYAGSAAAAEAALRLGSHYYTAGQYDEARTVYVTYLGQSPRGAVAFSAGIGVGDTYLAQRNYEKAAETYSRLVEQFPQDLLLPEAQLHLAKAYLGLNRPKDASTVYEKVVAAYPNTGWAQNAQVELNKLSITSR
ncbi:tetratricopeptide repeat protein [Candidatus Methylomirabilis sp.]|uniref:tetratricopeptide repeat protein n=1 Tax=Candidatus Methylomirabilis sp. TaxID=2032687 RepID=UPI002A637301|nr:tetratricopeptide repeat protein [Candidatus Methylomirabilis sp.]